MKRLLTTTIAGLFLASSAAAGTMGWGFKNVPGVTDGSTLIEWNGGSLEVIETADTLTVEVKGLDNLPAAADPTTQSGLAVWLAPWDQQTNMFFGNTFDLYLNPHFNSFCDVLVTPFMVNFGEGTVGSMIWDNPTGADNGHCFSGTNNVTITAEIASMPLPAGAALLLTGLAGFGFARRKSA